MNISNLLNKSDAIKELHNKIFLTRAYTDNDLTNLLQEIVFLVNNQKLEIVDAAYIIVDIILKFDERNIHSYIFDEAASLELAREENWSKIEKEASWSKIKTELSKKIVNS
ncbi:hypothetical protein KC678_00745 [Candidatus Dojkabacteria bacterium]|uniref:Uncharacterized protein n=1 Tax=Candidatus Dojkabacteria bacterium TaxID=2099670 RepID=A0A955L132_9BACT|nr:hypothetical protein [Candidatus Dojkabacteria bacterium]